MSSNNINPNMNINANSNDINESQIPIMNGTNNNESNKPSQMVQQLALKQTQNMNASLKEYKQYQQQTNVQHQDSSDLDNTNLYIKGLWKDCTQVELDDLFKQFGVIAQSRVYGDGVGFVRFEQGHSAKAAIERMDKRTLDRCPEQLLVKYAFKKRGKNQRYTREVEMIMNKNTHNVYLRCLPHGFDEKDLTTLCGEYGELTCTRLRESGVAFVRFRNADEAQIAIRQLNGKEFPNHNERLLAKLANSDPFQPKIGFKAQYDQDDDLLSVPNSSNTMTPSQPPDSTSAYNQQQMVSNHTQMAPNRQNHIQQQQHNQSHPQHHNKQMNEYENHQHQHQHNPSYNNSNNNNVYNQQPMHFPPQTQYHQPAQYTHPQTQHHFTHYDTRNVAPSYHYNPPRAVYPHNYSDPNVVYTNVPNNTVYNQPNTGINNNPNPVSNQIPAPNANYNVYYAQYPQYVQQQQQPPQYQYVQQAPPQYIVSNQPPSTTPSQPRVSNPTPFSPRTSNTVSNSIQASTATVTVTNTVSNRMNNNINKTVNKTLQNNVANISVSAEQLKALNCKPPAVFIPSQTMYTQSRAHYMQPIGALSPGAGSDASSIKHAVSDIIAQTAQIGLRTAPSKVATIVDKNNKNVVSSYATLPTMEEINITPVFNCNIINNNGNHSWNSANENENKNQIEIDGNGDNNVLNVCTEGMGESMASNIINRKVNPHNVCSENANKLHEEISKWYPKQANKLTGMFLQNHDESKVVKYLNATDRLKRKIDTFAKLLSNQTLNHSN